jgi:predicted negative regulator of RcsB-dependent stress response
VDVIRSEEEQIESLRKWWSENGLSVIGGIIIGFVAIFGWRSWQGYQSAQAEAASNLYANLNIDVRQQKFDHAREVANRILSEYKETGYAIYASLLLAKFDVNDSKPDSAIKHLQWVIDNADQNELKHLARLRMARLLLSENKSEQALQLLDSAEHGEFTASYEELKGDILLQQGNTGAARTAYQLALSESSGAVNNNTFLQMKIDNLGREN